MPERETGITIPEGDHYVRVRVTGGILISSTPDDAINGYTVGPWGLTAHTPFPFCEVYTQFCTLEVIPRLYSPPLGGWGFGLNDMGNNVGESVVRVWGPGWFTVERRGLTCGNDEGVCFGFSGHQTLSVDFVALALHASSTTPAPGEVVHFDAESVNVALGLPTRWWFRPAGSDDYIWVADCADKFQCDFAPPSTGLVLAESWLGSGFVGGEVALTPATAAVTILKAKGPNLGGSFTAKPGENQIALQAQVTPVNLSSGVTWRIEEDPSHYPLSPLPPTPPQGADASFTVQLLGPGRWPGDHGASLQLEPKQLSYKVTATVTDGTGHVKESETKLVTQDEIDTAREEYVELGVSRGVPARGVFGAHFGNRGDYGVAVINPDFDGSFVALELQWSPSTLQVNSLYRNPVHNRWHVPGAANSLHQYGCAADLQTFPVLPAFPPLPELQKAQNYWDLLRDAVIDAGFDVEQRDPDPATPQQASSGVGHVHIETECI